jgi:hypothetical protein
MRKLDLHLDAQARRILAVQAEDAHKMHMIWMERGYSFLKGTPINLPPGFAANDELCPVGHWLRERLDEQFRALPLLERTNKLHDEFHRALDQLFSQDITQVPRAVENRFREVGDDLTRALEEWIALSRTVALH